MQHLPAKFQSVCKRSQVKMCEEFFNDSFIDYWCITFQEENNIQWNKFSISKNFDLEVMMIYVVRLFSRATEDPEMAQSYAIELFELVKIAEPNEKIKNPINSFKKCLSVVAKRFKSYLKRSIHSTDAELVKVNKGIVNLVGHLYNMGLDDGEIIIVYLGSELKLQHDRSLFLHLLHLIKDSTIEKICDAITSKSIILRTIHCILARENIIENK